MEKPTNNIPNNVSEKGINAINYNPYQNNVAAPIGVPQTIAYAQPPNLSNQNYNQNVPISQGQQVYLQPVQPAYVQIPQTNREQNQVIVLVNPGYIGGNPPRNSFITVCPHCKETVNTIINYKSNSYVWLLCFLLFLFTVFLCCIPFCIDSIKDVVHYYPRCNRVIAIHKGR